MKKAALHNLGCKVTSYETQAMIGLFKEKGYEIVTINELIYHDNYHIDSSGMQISDVPSDSAG